MPIRAAVLLAILTSAACSPRITFKPETPTVEYPDPEVLVKRIMTGGSPAPPEVEPASTPQELIAITERLAAGVFPPERTRLWRSAELADRHASEGLLNMLGDPARLPEHKRLAHGILRRQTDLLDSRPGPQAPDPWRDLLFDTSAQLIMQNPDAESRDAWDMHPEWVTEDRMDRLVELIRETDGIQRGKLIGTFAALTHTWGWNNFMGIRGCGGTGLMTPEEQEAERRRWTERGIARQNEGLVRLLAWWDENHDAGYEAWARAAVERSLAERIERIDEYEKEISLGVYDGRMRWATYADARVSFRSGLRPEMGPFLAETYDTCDPRCRPVVITLLCRTNAPAARPVLRRMLTTPDPYNQHAACDAVREQLFKRDPRFAHFDTEISALLTHANRELRWAAAWALSDHATFDSADTILGVVVQNEHFVVGHLREAIARLALNDPDELAECAESIRDPALREWVQGTVNAARAWRSGEVGADNGGRTGILAFEKTR